MNNVKQWSRLLLCFVGFVVLNSHALDPQEIENITAEFVQYLHQSHHIVKDIAANQYLTDLCRTLSKARLAQYEPLHCFLLNDARINAFSGPGGYLGVYTGLVLFAQNEHEFASVIAHEIGHIRQKHFLRQLEQMKLTHLSMTLTQFVPILLGAHSPELGRAAILSGTAGIKQWLLTYSREQEAEADRIGFDLLSHSPYQVRAMIDFFKRLLQKERFSIALPEILHSHPQTMHRIADIENRLQPRTIKPKASLEFELFKAKLACLSNQKVTLKQAIAREYSRQLTYLAQGNHQQLSLKKLIPFLHNQPFIKVFAIDYAIAMQTPLPKNFTQLGATYHSAIENQLFEYYLSRAEYLKATQLLQKALSRAPKDPNIWFAYATLAARQWHEAEAYLYRAQALYCLKKHHEAKRLLNIAREKKSQSPNTKIKIDALMKQLKIH